MRTEREPRAPAARTTRRCRGGFSLAELVVALTVGGLALTMVLGALLTLSRSSARLTLQSDEQRDKRSVLVALQQELRQVEEVHVAGRDRLEVSFRDLDGQLIRVAYRWQADAGELHRTVGNRTTVLLTELQDLSFAYFDRHGDPTATLIDVYAVQMLGAPQAEGAYLHTAPTLISGVYAFRNRQP